MTGQLAVELAKTGEGAKAGPIGLAVILLLCIACYFLFKSMSKHMRRVRETFPAGDTTAGDTTAGDTTAGDTIAGDTTAGDTSPAAPTPPTAGQSSAQSSTPPPAPEA